jgi:hypothetical protein
MGMMGIMSSNDDDAIQWSASTGNMQASKSIELKIASA